MTNLEKLIKKRQKLIEHLHDLTAAELKVLEKDLLKLILSEAASIFKTVDGKLVFDTNNIRGIRKIDLVMEQFKESDMIPFVKDFAEKSMQVVAMTGTYYKGLGFAENKIDDLLKNFAYLEQALGIEIGKTLAGSKIVAGSFLDTLATMPEVKERLKQYTLNQIAGKQSFDGFLKGYKEILVDNELASKYIKRYAWDTFNNIQAAADLFVAESLDLKHFVYSGDTINTTRDFCLERAGQVFTVENAEDWNSEEWQGKIPGIPFFIQRGGYNCRHEIDFISEELYNQMNKND